MKKEQYKQYYQEHKEEILLRQRKYYQEHKEEICKRRVPYLKKYNQENKEKRNQQSKEYRKTHPGLDKKYRKLDPEGFRKRRLKQLYGITPEEYDNLLKKQNGVCAVCGNPETKRHKSTTQVCRLVVDHNHETGQIRALLCNQCNRLVGWLEAAPETIQHCLTYLREQNSKGCLK